MVTEAAPRRASAVESVLAWITHLTSRLRPARPFTTSSTAGRWSSGGALVKARAVERTSRPAARSRGKEKRGWEEHWSNSGVLVKRRGTGQTARAPADSPPAAPGPRHEQGYRRLCVCVWGALTYIHHNVHRYYKVCIKGKCRLCLCLGSM